MSDKKPTIYKILQFIELLLRIIIELCVMFYLIDFIKFLLASR